jgi:hypothetical protein
MAEVLYSVMTDGVSPTAAALIDINFNVAGRADITEIKTLAARLVTLMEPYQAKRDASGRLASIAITDIEKAAMVMVKAVTRPQP